MLIVTYIIVMNYKIHKSTIKKLKINKLLTIILRKLILIRSANMVYVRQTL